jgi:hypothetical protein
LTSNERQLSIDLRILEDPFQDKLAKIDARGGGFVTARSVAKPKALNLRKLNKASHALRNALKSTGCWT